MGKEQDLLQAAKSGNVAHIERILGNKARKSGIQSLMSRTVNPNHQDELGNTPLHYAALNGHRSSAELLLKYDASTNIPDNNGNYPLHLAAWNGHADVAKVLINTGPSRANVNEQNGTEDTALHSAAQFGHSLVVAVLLENHADPCIRNTRQESPLDLAAQYGRMETVKQFLNYHPNLLEDINVVRTHTPLHLAAKNGHMNVVSYFLSCGMDVNITSSSGTALHEAALFGKADVVNLLLHCGVDVTVVDHNNKTVLDLLASHPSAKTTEIRDLIFASSLKEPTSSLKRQFTEFQPTRKPFSGIHGASTFHGYSAARPSSAVYSRNLSYDDVPNPLPYRKDMDPSRFRRSGSYDAVPTSPTRQGLRTQSSYDIVPPPKEMATSPDWTKYDEVQDRSSAGVPLSYAGKGYSLLGPAEQSTKGAPVALTPKEIQGGYTLLGSPAQGEGNKPVCPLRPDSTYSEVRNEGDSAVPVRNASPSQTEFNDYSLLGFPTASEESEPMPMSGMAAEDNASYFLVGGHEQPQRQTSESYDFVTPKPRGVSQRSVYEVPPSMSQRGRGNGQEDDTTPSPAPPSRTSRGQSFDVYENTSITTPPQENKQRRPTDYDFVALPARKATVEASSYDVVPPPSQVAQEQLTNQELPTATLTSTWVQGDKVCPLSDAEGYEFVQLRKPEETMDDSVPEMQPFASLPGYLPMGPPQPEDGYEKLSAPVDTQEQLRNYGAAYETLSMTGPQTTGSQIGTGPRNIPMSAPLYEVPPTTSPPVYEIAPPPRSTSQVPPVPPRQPSAVQSQPPSDNEVQWIEKEPVQPKLPSRRQNEYSDWNPSMRREPVSPGMPTSPAKPVSPGKPASPGKPVTSPSAGTYEQVRVEGPEKDAMDWERVRQMNLQRHGGDYCMLSITAQGPREVANRESTASSERSSISEPVMTPPFSPPSPRTAGATVFEVLGAFQPADMSTIPEVPEDVKDQQHDSKKREAPIPKPRRNVKNKTKPEVLPRNDSLFDEEFHAPEVPRRTIILEEANQDPFSFPPVVSSSDAAPKKDSPKKSDFAELHKRFSPNSSREDIFTYADAAEKKREEPDGAETESDVKPSPLIYENVLFKRRDNEENGEATSEDGSVVKQEESTARPESFRLSTLAADSPMDEIEEWEKIEAFLSSIGQIEVPQTLEEQIADAGKAETVPGWLKALDLGQYESSMMANGFDDIRFLNGVIEDEDLLQMGIVDFAHRRTIMEALKSLPSCPRLSDPAINKPESLKEWLELLCLSEYFDVFQHNGFTSMDRIHMLWEVELTSVLEVNSLGHRKRILTSIKEDIKEPETPEQPEDSSLYVSSAQLAAQLAELKMYCPDEKPQIVSTPTTTNAEDLMAAAEDMKAGVQKEIKPKTKPKKSCKWKHDSSVLIKSCVNYSTLYLGSHMVKTITGLESTIEACRKMRLSTAKLQKIPSVILSVSVKGIKFIDARSKIMVSHHDMRNISYITQDPEDKRVFAYIAKDSKTEKHYCHVFRVDSYALSDEVTMSIGQAFELAFSQFVQAQNRR